MINTKHVNRLVESILLVFQVTRLYDQNTLIYAYAIYIICEVVLLHAVNACRYVESYFWNLNTTSIQYLF
jgi:hypothetical protein